MTNNLTLRFEAPPARKGGRRPSEVLQEIARQLTERPGEWALIRSCVSRSAAGSLAHHVRKGTSPAFRPTGAFEATVRDQDVYARYTGPDGDHL